MFGEVNYEHDGFVVVVRDVPMSVFSKRGEHSIPGPIAVMISDAVADAVANISEDMRASDIVSASRVEASLKKTSRDRVLALD